MTHNNEWSELSDSYAEHTPRIVGEVIRPSRPLTAADLDDIFAGRPLAEQPRQQASVMCKTYLTPDMASRADMHTCPRQLYCARPWQPTSTIPLRRTRAFHRPRNRTT